MTGRSGGKGLNSLFSNLKMVRFFKEVGKRLVVVGDYVPELLIFLLVLATLFGIVQSDSLKGTDKLSTCLSIIALAVSVCTLRHVLRPKPNVRLVEGRFPEHVHVGEPLPLIFYNSGGISTYVKVSRMQTDRQDLQVLPASLPTDAIGARCYCHNTIKVQKRNGGDIDSAIQVKVFVEFFFWRGHQIRSMEGNIILDLVPRGQ